MAFRRFSSLEVEKQISKVIRMVREGSGGTERGASGVAGKLSREASEHYEEWDNVGGDNAAMQKHLALVDKAIALIVGDHAEAGKLNLRKSRKSGK